MLAGNRHLIDLGKHTISVLTVWVVMTLASGADASILFDLLPVDNSAALTGYVTYDLRITTGTDWTVAAGVLELSAGGIYQHAQGTDNGTANPFLSSQYPGLAFDTHVVGNIAGGAGDLEEGTGYAFNDRRLDVSWYNITQTDIGETMIGRVTLTDDAAGSLAILLSASDEDVVRFDVAISPGVLPSVTQIIEEVVEDDPHEWSAPVLPMRDDLAGLYGTGYGAWLDGYYQAPSLMPSYTDPTLDLRRLNYSYNRGHLLPNPTWDDRHSERTNTLWLNPRGVKIDGGDSFNLLPEPGSVGLLGVGGLVVMRHRRGVRGNAC